MDRRRFITGFGAATALAAGAAIAQEKTPDHPHAGHPDVKVPARPQALDTILETTSACQSAGAVCLSHCSYYVLQGDEKMAECQRAVMNMLAITKAMHDMAGFNTAAPGHLRALAKVCADFCRACEKACEPHADHHPECKACRDACQECARACDAYAGAA
jgi:Cys-rich four helix bundle protein (predicted Tat secretion target)